MVTDRERPAAGDHRPHVNPGSVDKARDVVQALSKYIHGKKIYAKNNPTLVKFADEFRAAFRQFVEEHDELVLTVEQNALRWEGQLVYENNKRDESIAFLLYKDGVGEVTLARETGDSELEGFVDIIKDELHGAGGDGDDVVTQLWKADFDNIGYRVLDEYLVGEFGDGRRGEGAAGRAAALDTDDHVDLPSLQDKGRVIVDARRYGGSIEAYLAELLDKSNPDVPSEKREEAFQELVESLFSVSSDEMRRCRDELDAEKERDPLVDFLESILFFTRQENPSSFRDICNVIDAIVNYILNEGNPDTLAEALLVLRAFVGEGNLGESATAYFQKIDERFTDTAYLHALGKAVEHWSGNSGPLIAFYRQVGARVVPAVCTLLEDVEDYRAHQALCEVLVDVAPDDLPRIMEALNMDNPLIARDVASLLREISKQSVPPITQELMYYPDLRVREEVIRFLAGVGNEDAVLMLVRLLEHDDKSTRIKTLAAMEEIQSPIITNKLMAMAFDKELGEKTSDEQEHVFRTLGKCAGRAALPEIKRMLERKNPFGFGKNQKQHDKVLAIRALEHIDDAESTRILRDLTNDANGMVRAKAQRVLRASENAPKA